MTELVKVVTIFMHTLIKKHASFNLINITNTITTLDQL